jgi:hypothetical protein
MMSGKYHQTSGNSSTSNAEYPEDMIFKNSLGSPEHIHLICRSQKDVFEDRAKFTPTWIL